MAIIEKCPHVKLMMTEHFGVRLTDHQLMNLLLFSEDLYETIQTDSTDTWDRELMINVIVNQVMGNDSYWPTNGDSDEYTHNFFVTFFPKAEEFGYNFIK